MLLFVLSPKSSEREMLPLVLLACCRGKCWCSMLQTMCLNSKFSCYEKGSLLSLHHHVPFPQATWISSKQQDFLYPALAARFSTGFRHQRHQFPFVSFIKQPNTWKGVDVDSNVRTQCRRLPSLNAGLRHLQKCSSWRQGVKCNKLTFLPQSKTYWNLHVVNRGSGAVKCHILKNRTSKILSTVRT